MGFAAIIHWHQQPVVVEVEAGSEREVEALFVLGIVEGDVGYDTGIECFGECEVVTLHTRWGSDSVA